MATEEELKLNPFLRREAGEGWNDQDVDPQLFKLIVAREVAVDSLAEGLISVGSPEEQEYQHLAKKVIDYKEQHEISDPPPLPPEED